MQKQAQPEVFRSLKDAAKYAGLSRPTFTRDVLPHIPHRIAGNTHHPDSFATLARGSRRGSLMKKLQADDSEQGVKHSEQADEASVPSRSPSDDLQTHLDAAGKGVSQRRMTQALQTAMLRGNRNRRNPQAEQSRFTHLRACERYPSTIRWYRQRYDQRRTYCA